MLLKNNAKRLITINVAGGKSYRILPGINPAVEVPNKHCKADYVQALIKCGDLLVQGAGEDEPEEVVAPEPVEAPAVEPAEPTELELLTNKATSLGIKVDKRWSVERLSKEIDKLIG